MSVLIVLGLVGCSNAPKADVGGPTTSSAAPADGDALDRAIGESWAQASVSPAPRSSDAEFVRRVHLDLIGRIPTRHEARAFLESTNSHKRERLVDELLGSEEYAEHWADVYMDELFGSDPKVRRQIAFVSQWLSEELAADRPYDELVDELITAEGAHRENPAVAYVAVHNRREKLVGPTNATASSLLGVQLGCAQCHDHPYDDYSRDDFWALSAFYARTRTQIEKNDDGRTIVVTNKRRGEARIKDERSERKRAVEPSFLGREVVIEEGEDRREVLSRLVQESPLMAKAATGRNWTALFGDGIVSPWNDLGGESAEHPELLEVLAQDFVDDGYSLKAQLRAMVLSDAYQRSSESVEGVDVTASRAVFAQASVRPLTVHQLFNSLMVSTGLESVENRAFRRAVTKRKNKALQEFVFTFGDEEALDADSFSGNVPQVLLLLNGGLTNEGVVSREGSLVDQVLREVAAPTDRIDELFLATYSRMPSADERERMLGLIETHGGDAEGAQAPYEDLLFALLLSSEFLSNH